MSYSDVPTSVRSLEQRIRNLEGTEELAIRRRVGMALVVVGQMLPEGAIKGGSAMALRYGRGTRFTQDLDAARVQRCEVVITAAEADWTSGTCTSRSNLPCRDGHQLRTLLDVPTSVGTRSTNSNSAPLRLGTCRSSSNSACAHGPNFQV